MGFRHNRRNGDRDPRRPRLDRHRRYDRQRHRSCHINRRQWSRNSNRNRDRNGLRRTNTTLFSSLRLRRRRPRYTRRVWRRRVEQHLLYNMILLEQLELRLLVVEQSCERGEGHLVDATIILLRILIPPLLPLLLREGIRRGRCRPFGIVVVNLDTLRRGWYSLRRRLDGRRRAQGRSERKETRREELVCRWRCRRLGLARARGLTQKDVRG